ncbi:MAG: kelch repeat-containing protein [Candidatus Alcyoniella australis]|nr:kelch repeat-containing protein [Candidatus Alcyoniella australis]
MSNASIHPIKAALLLAALLAALLCCTGCPEDEPDLDEDETDIDAPYAVSLFSAAGYIDRVELTWTNPTSRDSDMNKDFVGVMILRNEGTPISALPLRDLRYIVGEQIGADTVVFVGSSQSFIDGDVEPGKTYYYAAVSFDEVPNYGDSAQTNATPGSSIKARIAHTLTVLDDGRVLIVGGVSYDGPQDTAEIYDPASGTFSLLEARMHEERYWHSATKLADGRVLIAGGQLEAFADSLSNAEIFDPQSETFDLIGSTQMGTGRAGHCAAVLEDGAVLLVGGTDGQDQLDDADLFNPVGGFAASAAQLCAPRSSATINALTIEGQTRLLVCGGFDGETSLNSCQLYSATEDAFTDFAGVTGECDEMADRRLSHSATLIQLPVAPATIDDDDDDDEPQYAVLLAGGDAGDLAASNVVDSAEIYDPADEALLYEVGPMSTPRSGQAAVALDDAVLLIGGVDENINALSSAELYDVELESFVQTGSMGFVRAVPQAVLLGDGRVLVVGGNLSTNVFEPRPLSAAEIYDPLGGSFGVAYGE